MMTKMATNRLARKIAVRLVKKDLSVPLDQLQKIVERLARSQSTNATLAAEQGSDLRIIALETAMALHQSQIDAKPEAMRWTDSHKWPEAIEALYHRILGLLQKGQK